MKNRHFKRIFAAFLAFALTLGLCPAATAAEGAEAAPAALTCPSCGLTGEALAWENWALPAENRVSDHRHLKLTKNVTLTQAITVTGQLFLDLNGFTLKAAKQDRAFDVAGGTLILADSTDGETGAVVGGDVSGLGSENNAYTGGTIRVTDTGALHILSGTVKDGSAAQGGNIFCARGTFLNISGGTVQDGYAVALDGSTGRGGNLYTMATAIVNGNARIVGGYAQYGSGNSGRGGNLFIHNRGTLELSGSAIIAGGYAGQRGGNVLANYHSELTVKENAEIYGGTAKTCGNNIDVMTATLTVEGGTIYGSPAGGCKTNIYVYSTSSVFNFTGGKIYGKVHSLAGMTINISGKPYIEHLYLPQTLDATGNETARALVNPGTFEPGAWVGLEVQAEDQRFTDVMTDTGSYMYFFPYDKTGLTWHGPRNAELQYLYLTDGTPCACCGEDIAPTDIEWVYLDSFERVENPTLTPGHYQLTRDINVDDWEYPGPITVDGVEGYVTLDLNGHTLQGATGYSTFNILAGSTFNIVDNSEAKSGILRGGQNRAIEVLGEGTTVNLYSGTLTGAVTGDGVYGGAAYVYSNAVLNIYGGGLENGTAEDHAGNLFIGNGGTVNLYDGTIAGGTATGGTDAEGYFSGNGGNIYVTGTGSSLHIYGGLITGGKAPNSSGGNIFVNSGASAYMYDGVIEEGGAKNYGANLYVTGSRNGKYSSFSMYGGSFGGVDGDYSKTNGISRGSTDNPIKIFNGTVYTTQKATHLAGDCACFRVESDATYFWNYGHNENTCDYNCQMEQAWGKGYVKSLNTGVHDYLVSGNTCTCTICGYTFSGDNLAAVVNGRVYETLAEAVSKANAGSVITLLSDVTEEEFALVNGVTLDLNGFTLTATAFSGINGHIVDTTGGDGLLVSDSISLADNNAHLPVSAAEGLRFSSITPDHTLERLDEDTVRIRFTFRERAADTILDDLIKAGNTELSVALKLTWTDAAGEPQEMTYICDHSLLQKYAEKWNGRRYVATIRGVAVTDDLTCTVQVSSVATGNVTMAATPLRNVAYINQKLTWDAINSYPLKTKDMTVAEMRQAVVDFMFFTKTYLWTPDQDVKYLKNSKDTEDVMNQGTVYGGLPYVGVASGNCYRMMDYINPETGLLDMEKAIPALTYKDSVTMADLKYFGSQCSIAVYWGWGRVMNSAKYRWTSDAVPKNDFIVLGDVQIPNIDAWTTTYGTDECCKENGAQTMFEAYGQLKKADGLVYYTTAGHLVMAYADAVVVRKANGTIDGDKSYVYLIDQAQVWKTMENDAGDTFTYKSGINEKYTFTKLYNTNYIPFTFKEFLGQSQIQDTTVALTDAAGNAYIDGTIRESDRAYETALTTDTLALEQFFNGYVKSNYGVVDVYLTLYNKAGEEFYRHAVRAGYGGNKNLELAQTGEMVTIWQLANIFKNRSYSGKIEVQLGTGERVVIFDGTVTT